MKTGNPNLRHRPKTSAIIITLFFIETITETQVTMTEDKPYVIEMTQSGKIIVTENGSAHASFTTIKKSLNEDIYALTAIVYAKNRKLPIGLTLISIFICVVQFAGLLGLAYGYQVENDTVTSLVYRIKYLEYNNQILITNAANNSGQIILEEIGQRYGDQENFDVYDTDKLTQKDASLNVAGIFLGWVALFILLMYMLQSMSSATFFWYLPDHVHQYKSIYGLKIMVKIVAVTNLILIYLAWYIGVWTLFHYKDPIEIVDTIMVPLGIVFVLEVDDWIVTPYLMIDVESDSSEYGDVDDSYQDSDDLWVVHTTRSHIREFKWSMLVEILCMLLPPILYFTARQIKWNHLGEEEDVDNFFWNDSMVIGGLAIFTYSTVTGIIIIAIGIKVLYLWCRDKQD